MRKWILAGYLFGLAVVFLPALVDAKPVSPCAQAQIEAGHDRYSTVFEHTVGCDEGQPTGANMCNRYAYRLLKSYLHQGYTVVGAIGLIQERTENVSSNGHPCRSYEDGTYGFPDKAIDCAVDPRC